jgi:hypothetical protein
VEGVNFRQCAGTFRFKSPEIPPVSRLSGSFGGLRPWMRHSFPRPGERAVFAEAGVSAQRSRSEAGRIADLAHRSRWSQEELTDEDLRRLYSYWLSFQELKRGEVFVQQDLRNRARLRQRRVLGVPAIAIALGAGLRMWRGRGKAVRSRRRR